MKAARQFSLVVVTAPNLATARQLVRVALEERLVACGNLVPRLESHYWWQGKLETSREVLVLFKTRKALLHRLERLVLKHHPYDTPEILSLPIESGTNRYLAWITESTRPQPFSF